jgi:pimeloyl-ACP methyl ester carboxylesterase
MNNKGVQTVTSIPTLPGITSQIIDTPRLRIHILSSGPDDGIPVLFIHGNASSATYWEEQMLLLPAGFRGIAPDLRGYGSTEDKLVDATRGYGDWVDDLLALASAMNLDRYHVVGHSLGGGVAYGLLLAAGPSVLSVTLVDPVSPYGFGGTRGAEGTPIYDDFAGSGGGTVNPEFTRLLGEAYRGTEHGLASPRVVMNSFYWKPPFVPVREEELLSSLLTEKVGGDRYPGDMVASTNWPGVAPGVYGPINAGSPKYVADIPRRLVEAADKPPILWVRGSDDQIVSDTSLFDLGFLGQVGAVPGWPGADAYPPQPMVSQTRAVLEQYQASGGSYHEAVIADAGHTPQVEKPEEFRALLAEHLHNAHSVS